MKNIKNQSLKWLKKGTFKRETEALLLAVQALKTRNFEKRIIKIVQYDECRICQSIPETTDRTASPYPILAKENYIRRHHDRV